MSDCCTAKVDRTPVQRGATVCPDCACKANSVSTLTVKSLVHDHTQVSKDSAYWFCRTLDCEVVYFSDKAVFRKADVKVRVGLKEREEPIPLCYCFGYDHSDIRRDIDVHGRSEIPDRIKAEVKAGFCACEVKNPSGTCCLGDVNRAVQTHIRNMQSESLPAGASEPAGEILIPRSGRRTSTDRIAG